MSGIACIVNLDGRPVSRRVLERMNTSMAHRGSDAVGLWIDGPAGMASRMFWTTPEAVGECHPLRNAAGTRHLLMDGRIDNGLSPFDVPPADLLGDFAFMLWDAQNRRLLCARDILGVKPLYYYTNGKIFVAASEIQAILAHPDVPQEPNEGMIGEFLAEAPTSLEETLYLGIQRLPPAHTLTIDANSVRLQRYWSIDPAKEIRYRRDDEYADHFLEIFSEAVRCRLRSHGRVGSDLSGGLDSSSVVCMAARMQDIETFSLVFPGQEACDERRYIDAVVERSGATPNLLTPDCRDVTWAWNQVKRHQDLPDYPNGAMSYPLYRLARDKGFRVVLGGDGGDQWLDGSYYHAADLLKKGRLYGMWKRMKQDAAVWSLRGYASHLKHYAVKPLMQPAHGSGAAAFPSTSTRSLLNAWG